MLLCSWVKVHTGNIDCFWKGAKKSIPGSLSSKVKGRRNVQLWKCLRRFQWRWEHTGKDMCKHTSKTLRTLWEKRRPRTWDLFEPKTLEGLLLKKQTIIFSDSLKHQNCIAIVVKRNFLLKSWAGNESAGIFIYLSIHLFNDTPRVETDPPVVLVQFPCCSVPANPNGVSAKAVPCLLLKSKIDGSDRRVSPPHNFNKFHGVNNDAAPGCLIARGTI